MNRLTKSIDNFPSPVPFGRSLKAPSRHWLIALLLLTLLTGCASMATQQLANNLASAMLNQDDPDTVRAGAPAYLLLLDGMISDHPDDQPLLIAGARLYGALAGGLIRDPARKKLMTNRARVYARQALCLRHIALCTNEAAGFEHFASALKALENDDPTVLYAYATSWAGWIAARTDDWNALADLPKVELLLEHIIQTTPDYDNGRAQLYLGVMRSQLPPALGGKPETGRYHFEQAIAYSQGRDLMAKVEFARRYARLMFDQPLHDRLLKEVLEAPAQAPDLTLSNTLAKQQAAELLADDYF